MGGYVRFVVVEHFFLFISDKGGGTPAYGVGGGGVSCRLELQDLCAGNSGEVGSPG